MKILSKAVKFIAIPALVVGTIATLSVPSIGEAVDKYYGTYRIYDRDNHLSPGEKVRLSIQNSNRVPYSQVILDMNGKTIKTFRIPRRSSRSSKFNLRFTVPQRHLQRLNIMRVTMKKRGSDRGLKELISRSTGKNSKVISGG